VIRDLVSAYPFARTIHLVMDNLNIHCRKSLTDHLGEREGNYLGNRLKIHHTPKHRSWLNQAEIELSLISRQCLGTRRIPDLARLKSETQAWNRRANRQRTKIRWNFTRKAARWTFGYVKKLSRRSHT
jgi:DDE superfamily endonuclease